MPAWTQRTTTGTSTGTTPVLASGFNSSTNIFYTWDGTTTRAMSSSGAWSTITTTAHPDFNYVTGSAWDSGRSRLVALGVYIDLNTYVETFRHWEFDGSNWTMRNITLPPTRRWAAVAYDSVRSKTVLYGGYNGSYNHNDDTWEFDGTTWRQVTTATTPPGRYNCQMAFDVARQKMVMYGGYLSGAGSTGTWEYNGTNWTARTATVDPYFSIPLMAYDSERGRVVIFQTKYSSYGGEVSEWDGSTWAVVLSMSSGPSVRGGGSLYFNASRNRMQFFGGANGNNTPFPDAWEY